MHTDSGSGMTFVMEGDEGPEYILHDPDWPGVCSEDYEAVINLLRRIDPLVSAKGPGKLNLYDPTIYLSAKAQGFTVRFVLDLNVVLDILSLVRVRKGQLSENVRCAAALMLFAKWVDVDIDPSNAFQEYCRGGKDWRDRVQIVRTLDNARPSVLIDCALGRANVVRFDPRDPPGQLVSAAEKMPKYPVGWTIDRIISLKVVLLLLDALPGRPNALTMKRFMNWMTDEFFWSAPATVYACMALGKCNISGMYKGYGSGDSLKILKGVDNATADLAFIRNWAKTAVDGHAKGIIPIMATFDKAIRKVAPWTVTADGPPPEEVAEKMFGECWGESDGPELASLFMELQRRAATDMDRRSAQVAKTVEELATTMAELEEAVRQASSKVRTIPV